MRRVFIFFIRVYQKIPGVWHMKCRFSPTCSNYAIEALERYGTIIGLYLSIKRIIRCNPWGGYGYDPVPDIILKRER